MKEKNVNFKLMKQLFINFLFLSSSTLLLAQTTDYNNLDNWDHICYCSMNNSFHPQAIVQADNNWQLLLALKDGLTLKQLDSLKISYTQSQLLLLRSQRLLSKTQNVYTTAIPILDSAQTNNFRRQSRLVASDIYPEIEKECNDLVSHLSEQSRSSNAFSILFSYVFDGLIWKRFEKEGIIKEKDGTGIWSGNYWFLTPKRPFYCGTNSLSNEKFIFRWNWSYAEKITDELWGKNIDALFPFAQRKTVVNKEIIDEFSPLGFFDKNLNLTIPVINEKENNTLCLLSNKIIDKLLPAFLAKTNVDSLKSSYKFSDDSETVVIFYHEVMWDLMDLLLEKKVIKMPTAFQSSDKATLKDVADLCFIIILR